MTVKKGPVVAIVGATGVVGSEMLRILEERKVPVGELCLFASKESVGELYAFHGEEIEVEELAEDSFSGVNYALFAVDSGLAEKYVPIAREAGVTVVDNSSLYRLQEDIPLVVPEVNGDLVTGEQSLIANPNCTTAQLVPVLAIMHRAAGLKRVVLSTYQAVSGAGKEALDELWEQTRAVFTQSAIPSEAFQHQIAFNCIPQIDVMLESGYTREEEKVIQETRKILGMPELPITVTAVRVPVFHSHGESVNVELEQPLSREDLLALFEADPSLEVYSHPEDLPLQIDAATRDPIFVGRIRKDESVPSGFNLWLVADNLRKGAALNAVQILEKILTMKEDGLQSTHE